MSLRAIALLVVFCSLAAYGALLRPMRFEVEREEARYATARAERNRLRARLAELEHVRARRSKESSTVGGDAMPFRRAVVSSLQGASLAGVRIDARASAGGMTLTLSGTGSLPETLRVLGSLLGPGVGVVPHRVHLTPIPEGVSFTLEGERRP
jgi:hypothetical protein